MTLFFIIITLIVLSLTAYLYRWGIKSLKLEKRNHLILSGLLFFLVSMLFIGPIVYRGNTLPIRSAFAQNFQWIHYSVMGWLGMLIMFSILYQVSTLVIRTIIRLGLKKSAPLKATTLADRRLFLTRSSRYAIAGTSLVTAGAGLSEAMHGPKVIKVQVKVSGLHPDLDGFKIAQISDLHIGPTIDRTYCQRVVDLVKTMNPDIVALTGDLMDGNLAQLEYDMQPILDLKNLGKGAFFCTGNHEYYSGADQWIQYFSQNGIRTLSNEHELVNHGSAQILIAGINDPSHFRADPSHVSDPFVALQKPQPAPRTPCFKLLLAHQPKSIFQAAAAGFDLQLSGHTHAGQFFPFSLLARLVFPYFEGLHKHENTWIYVNRGTGYWGPPNRFGNFSEVTELTLTRV